jgi:hypothetical protein
MSIEKKFAKILPVAELWTKNYATNAFSMGKNFALFVSIFETQLFRKLLNFFNK